MRFLCAGFRLLELDDETASASLTDAFETFVGYAPDFSAAGDAVTGLHFPADDPDERQIVIVRRANKQAVRRTLSLLALRHRLAAVRVVTRPHATATNDDDWMPTVLDLPYDLDGVSVWPSSSTRVCKDSLLIEYATTPRSFASTSTERTTDVHDARLFGDAVSAWAWLDEHASDAQVSARPVWRSAALAQIDQQRASAGHR